MILLSLIAIIGWGLALFYMWAADTLLKMNDEAIAHIKQLEAAAERLERDEEWTTRN